MYVTYSTTSLDRLLPSCNHEMTSVIHVNGWNIFHNSKYTSLWGNFLCFFIALILTDILSFLGLLTHYNYSELVSSILHMTTSENTWDGYHILSKAFFPLTPRPSVRDVTCFLTLPLSSYPLSMYPSVKLQAQHSTLDLTCLWQHTLDLLHPLNETPGFLKPCSQLKHSGLKPGLSRFVSVRVSFL